MESLWASNRLIFLWILIVAYIPVLLLQLALYIISIDLPIPFTIVIYILHWYVSLSANRNVSTFFSLWWKVESSSINISEPEPSNNFVGSALLKNKSNYIMIRTCQCEQQNIESLLPIISSSTNYCSQKITSNGIYIIFKGHRKETGLHAWKT